LLGDAHHSPGKTRVMDDSLARLQARLFRQIEEREAALQPLRDFSLRRAAEHGDASAVLDSDIALVTLEQELAACKRMAERLARIVVFEPREHRAVRLPPQR
jgi:hypothetical protein